MAKNSVKRQKSSRFVPIKEFVALEKAFFQVLARLEKLERSSVEEPRVVRKRKTRRPAKKVAEQSKILPSIEKPLSEEEFCDFHLPGFESFEFEVCEELNGIQIHKVGTDQDEDKYYDLDRPLKEQLDENRSRKEYLTRHLVEEKKLEEIAQKRAEIRNQRKQRKLRNREKRQKEKLVRSEYSKKKKEVALQKRREEKQKQNQHLTTQGPVLVRKPAHIVVQKKQVEKPKEVIYREASHNSKYKLLITEYFQFYDKGDVEPLEALNKAKARVEREYDVRDLDYSDYDQLF